MQRTFLIDHSRVYRWGNASWRPPPGALSAARRRRGSGGRARLRRPPGWGDWWAVAGSRPKGTETPFARQLRGDLRSRAIFYFFFFFPHRRICLCVNMRVSACTGSLFRPFLRREGIKVCFLYFNSLQHKNTLSVLKAIWTFSACAQFQETWSTPKGKKVLRGWSRLYLDEKQHRLTWAETQEQSENARQLITKTWEYLSRIF